MNRPRASVHEALISTTVNAAPDVELIRFAGRLRWSTMVSCG